ncbi:MAG: pentapeptide repeat-containing protein, partial [Anaerolineae bacterium]|nr:pentapeptide repeat-containing protein [Anaerolineae bacterium]
VAQFIHLLLRNEKLRDVIGTISKKAILILGSFTPPERKKILLAIQDKLRERGYLPIIFDFKESEQRDFTETIKVLAGMSLFVIADITNPKSSPLELQATVPDYMIPFAPIIQKGEEPFAMFVDLQHKYKEWVLDVCRYKDEAHLLDYLDDGIIKPALEKHNHLIEQKNAKLRIRDIDEI